MKRKADELLHYDGQNPFSDSQPRNFSDTKVSNEFCPTSCFWSLFNDQHEVLIGTRGSGKTFLLKMMRRSMLKSIDDPNARKLIEDKAFFALYVPMQLEVLSEFKRIETDSYRQITLFQFFFNSVLAESLLAEIENLLNEDPDILTRTVKKSELAQRLHQCWFGLDVDQEVSSLNELSYKITRMYYSFDLVQGNLDDLPPLFTRQICSTLISVKAIIADTLELSEEPTWLVCVDEAEFLNETLQKCINNTFRANSNRIALKVATLPFYYTTLKTLVLDTEVSPGNDFNYRIVDMTYDNTDFRILTNKLCAHRLSTRMAPKEICVETLEDFLGMVGNDDLIDYYRAEVRPEDATREAIEAKIVASFSEKRRIGSSRYHNTRKTIYDKFAPIFFVREMYTRSGKGNSKPGWYAGAATVRKVSQGNPRMFIQIMNALFEKARKTKLTPKAQHEVILKFANDFCESTRALETYGVAAYNGLNQIGNVLRDKVHKGALVSVGCSFRLKYKSEADFNNTKRWLQKAIAYSRVIVADEIITHGLSTDTKFLLSNAYATSYWIPMRGDVTSTVPVHLISNTYMVSVNLNQTSLFEEDM